MIPSDVSGQGEKRVKLPDPVTVEQAREILKKVREAKRPVINAGNGIRRKNEPWGSPCNDCKSEKKQRLEKAPAAARH